MILFGAILIVSCAPGNAPPPTPNVEFIQTAAAQTVVSQFTLTAASWTLTPPAGGPTDTPAVLDTPTIGSNGTPPQEAVSTASATPTLLGGITATPVLCNYYRWGTDVDVNIPDGTLMTPGQKFVKTWKITNAGVCTWGAGYKVVYAGYNVTLSGQPVPLSGVVGPSQDTEISVQFIAPAQAGDYVSAWTLSDNKGQSFFGIGGKPLYVKIRVTTAPVVTTGGTP